MHNHPLRQKLLDEVHARTFPDFNAGGRFIRFVFLTEPGEDQHIIDHVNAFLKASHKPEMELMSKFVQNQFDDFSLRVERHTEFVSISIIDDGHAVKTGLADHAFDPEHHGYLPFDFIQSVPADLFHAIWVEIGGKPPSKFNQAKAIDMLGCRAAPSDIIDDQQAQLVISFNADINGFSRAVIFNHFMSDARLGRMVQRVVEMETYRFLAMLGFAKTQETSGKLAKLADDLTTLTRDLSKTIATGHDNEDKMHSLVKTLSNLSAQIEEIYADTLYRMSATKAYRDVFEARLEALNLNYLEGFQGIEGFIERRMTPAMQTCEAFSNRLDRVAGRIERAGQLLQTQTEMKIQQQNRDLLQSMDRRSQAQLRLQQTVEGLSIAALTYYGVGIVEYVAKGLPFDQWQMDVNMVKAIAVPIVGLSVFTIIRRTSKRIRRDTEQ